MPRLPPKKPRGPKVDQVRRASERNEEIADLIRHRLWLRGKSPKEYAAKWGVSIQRVNNMHAEAWRLVASESLNVDRSKPDIALMLLTSCREAYERGEHRALAILAQEFTKIVGGRAPERHEHSHVVAHFDMQKTEDKIRIVDENIAKLQAMRADLVSTVTLQ